MSKATTTLFILAILLYSTLSYAARPIPASLEAFTTPLKLQHEGIGKSCDCAAVGGEKCEGDGEEECLMRRTLVAHLDYIYTQTKNP